MGIGNSKRGWLRKFIEENPGLSIKEICKITGYGYTWVWECYGKVHGADGAVDTDCQLHDPDEPLMEIAISVITGMTNAEKTKFLEIVQERIERRKYKL